MNRKIDLMKCSSFHFLLKIDLSYLSKVIHHFHCVHIVVLRNTEHFGLIVDIHFYIFGKRRSVFGNTVGIALSLSR